MEMPKLSQEKLPYLSRPLGTPNRNNFAHNAHKVLCTGERMNFNQKAGFRPAEVYAVSYLCKLVTQFLLIIMRSRAPVLIRERAVLAISRRETR